MIEEFRAWLDQVGLEDWAAVVDEAEADPPRAAALLHELGFPSRWEAAVREQGRLELQLVDVQAPPGWGAEPLTAADTRALTKALRRWTGLPVRIELKTMVVDPSTWRAEEQAGFVRYVPGVWTPELVGEGPWLTTYAVNRHPDGRKVLVSASGGLVDQGAWVGNSSRPIDARSASIYAHELLHALGHLHHYSSALYAPGSDRRDGRAHLFSTDCIMAAGYVGGEWYGGPTADADGTPKMAPLLCPICRFRIHPRPARPWARRYRAQALFWTPR